MHTKRESRKQKEREQLQDTFGLQDGQYKTLTTNNVIGGTVADSHECENKHCACIVSMKLK